MKKLLNVILVLLLIAIIIVISLIIIKYAKNQENEKEISQVIESIKTEAKNMKKSDKNEEINANYKGYKILGTIKIDKIGIEYPILEYTTDDTLKISITKFYGQKVHQIGNFIVSGHNNYDGTMFGKTKNLEIGDTIELTDLYNITKRYAIYKKYITDPNDTSVTEIDELGTREVTLITCNNGNKERLIIKAREII